MNTHNPYSPPSADVADIETTTALTGDFIQSGRTVNVGRGWGWFKDAWQVFKPQKLMWWLALIVLFATFFLINLIPVLGMLATSLLGPVLFAGIASCAHSVLSSGNFEIRQVFDGFRRHTGQLMIVGGVWLLVMVIVIATLAFTFGAMGLFGMLKGDPRAVQSALSAGNFVVFFVIYFGLIAVFGAAYVFAPYLVFERGLSAFAAMKSSFIGCWRNIGAGIICILSYILWAIVATIPIGLGWLVLIPVLMVIGYVAYRDIYFTDSESA